MMVHGNGAFGDFTEVALPSDLVGVRTSWSKAMTINTAQVVHIATTTDAQLMVMALLQLVRTPTRSEGRATSVKSPNAPFP